MSGSEWCILNYNMNEEGSLIDLPRICSVLKGGLNPAFVSCPSDHKDGGVWVAFWFWIFNNNNKTQTKTKTPNITTKNHSSRNNEENTVQSSVCVGSKIWAEKKKRGIVFHWYYGLPLDLLNYHSDW